jgi:hypothetical protein
MAEHRPLDAEHLAAFIDGRLPPEQQAELIAALAHNPVARELLADATAALAEFDARSTAAARTASVDTAPREPLVRGAGRADTSPNTMHRPPQRTARWGWLSAVGVTVAASVALIVLVRRPDASDALAPAVATQLTVPPDDRGALANNRWTVVRSNTMTLAPAARAVRLGVLAVDAFLDRETAGADAREEMSALLEPVTGAGPARSLLANASDSITLAQATQATRSIVNTDAFDAGVALELLRAGGNQAGTSAPRLEVVARALEASSLTADRANEGRALLSQLRDHIVAGDAAGIRTSANTLLALLAG